MRQSKIGSFTIHRTRCLQIFFQGWSRCPSQKKHPPLKYFLKKIFSSFLYNTGQHSYFLPFLKFSFFWHILYKLLPEWGKVLSQWVDLAYDDLGHEFHQTQLLDHMSQIILRVKAGVIFQATSLYVWTCSMRSCFLYFFKYYVFNNSTKQ